MFIISLIVGMVYEHEWLEWCVVGFLMHIGLCLMGEHDGVCVLCMCEVVMLCLL